MKKLVAMVALLVLSLSGCSGLTIFSNYRKLESIELVRTITIDKAENGVNAAIYGTAGEDSEARMYEKTGESVGVTLGELQIMPLGRQAILSHTESVLIGEELAADGIDECLDYIERYAETRLDTSIFVVRDGTARDLVYGLSGKDTPASDVVMGLTEHIDRVGKGYVFTCREIASSLADNGCALVMCVRGVEEEKLFDARGDLNIDPAGFAILRDDGVEDFLTEEESLGAMLILSKLKSMEVDLPVGDTVLTVSIDGVKTDIHPVFSDDGALERVMVKLAFQANIVNLRGLTDIEDGAYRKEAEQALSREMLNAVRAALDKSQELGTDFMSLEGAVRRAAPLKTEDMPGTWNELFSALPIDIATESIIRRTYDITDPPQVVGEEEKRPWEKLIESLRDN